MGKVAKKHFVKEGGKKDLFLDKMLRGNLISRFHQGLFPIFFFQKRVFINGFSPLLFHLFVISSLTKILEGC